ncbi:hypothetical protein Nans01_18620 [Nocardiopsis ansamitocini]|uniref:PPM-type phosphatase domain-containing protein n=2 Tax=Nocardiopsis ansamitocini TaxID=1670832 RepID=A0A9W6P5M6_9ACTN|nr:hypothetical protein Nans01_18620 [Nocardiopsis ansamitocini]
MKVARREFSAAPETAGEARSFVRDTLRDWNVTRGSDDIILLVSELVTNAVIHAETTLELIVRRLPGAVEVVVVDRVPHRAVPKAGPLQVDTSPSTDDTRSGGLGLALASAIASSWGVSYSKEDKAVWFRLDDEEPPAGPTSRTSLVPPLPVRSKVRSRPEPWSRLDSALAAKLSLPDLLDSTVDVARTVLGGDAAYIALATTDETEWELQAAVGLTSGQWRPFRSRTEETFPSSAPEPGPVINDDLMIARAHRGRLAAAGMRSLVTAPLIVDGRITGLLGVASKRIRHFGQTAADRLQEGADRIALTVERSRLARVELARRASLSFLAEASDLLAGTLDEQMTAALAAQLTTSRLGKWCVVHTTSDLGVDRLAFATHRDENTTDVLRELITAIIPQEQREPGQLWQPEELAEAGMDDELTRELAAGLGISIPLMAHGRSLGRITIGKAPNEEFPREEVDVADDLAQRVSSAMENARLYSDQTFMSEALQRSLLPAKEKEPAIPRVDHAVFYQPAGERNVVGGDFYDVFATDGRWCFAIGDVCGTGPEAAAVTGLARHTLRALARENLAPAYIMHRLNLAILDENTTTRFLTMLYGEMTPIGGPDGGKGMRIRLVSAGHPLPLRLDKNGEVEPLATSQPLLGAFEDVEFFTETVEVAPGDVLLAVTDGVTERRNNEEMLGDEGLTKIFTGCSGLTAQAVIARIDRELEEFAPGGHTDDTAMLVLRFL